MSSLSSFNGWGELPYAEDPYGAHDFPVGASSDYGSSAVQASWYSYQEGLAGYGSYGANIFQRIFTPRKWEAEKRAEAGGEGFQEGSAMLFSRGTSKAERKALRKLRKQQRKFKKQGRQDAKKTAQYRVVRGAGGYVYKQDGHNCYTIMKSPKKKGPRKSGSRICKGDKYWQSIHGEVLADHGPFSPGASPSDWARLLGVGGGIGLDVLKIFKGSGDGPIAPSPGGGGAAMAAAGTDKTMLALKIGGGVLGLVILVSLLRK